MVEGAQGSASDVTAQSDMTSDLKHIQFSKHTMLPISHLSWPLEWQHETITFNRLSWTDWCVTWQWVLHTVEEDEDYWGCWEMWEQKQVFEATNLLKSRVWFHHEIIVTVIKHNNSYWTTEEEWNTHPCAPTVSTYSFFLTVSYTLCVTLLSIHYNTLPGWSPWSSSLWASETCGWSHKDDGHLYWQWPTSYFLRRS